MGAESCPWDGFSQVAEDLSCDTSYSSGVSARGIDQLEGHSCLGKALVNAYSLTVSQSL